MPKVKEGYFEAKKDSILEATEKICMEKPLYKITMKDIIKETGLSPGSIYSSFSNIDEVIVALINRLSANVDFVSTTDEIVQSQNTPEEKIKALISYFIELIHTTVLSYGKIFFELGTVYVDTERRETVTKSMNDLQMYNYVLGALINVMEDNIRQGYFKPKYSKESIFAIVFAFIDGLIRDLTLVKCYKLDVPQSVTFEESDLPKALAYSVIHLLDPTV